MAETMLRERCANSEESEQALAQLDQLLYPTTFERIPIDEDPFAGTEHEGMAPPWA